MIDQPLTAADYPRLTPGARLRVIRGVGEHLPDGAVVTVTDQHGGVVRLSEYPRWWGVARFTFADGGASTDDHTAALIKAFA